MSRRDAAPALPPRKPVSDQVTVPHRLAMGMSALPTSESWLELDADLEPDLALKRKLFLERRDEVFVEREESRPAQREVLDVLVDHLLAAYPSLYSRTDDGSIHVRATGDVLDGRAGTAPPLETAARCVQEDLCVMERREAGWCLTAGAVCFPTRWPLRPMLGRPMTAIHERVPGYREQLDRSANAFFDGMKGGAVFRRGNWSLLDDPALFQPTGTRGAGPRGDLDGRSAGEKVWLRVEHQTLQRLMRSGAILFSIRVHRTRLDDAAAEPSTARALLGAIETMAPAMQHYKSLGLVRDATVDYLEARLANANTNGNGN